MTAAASDVINVKSRLPEAGAVDRAIFLRQLRQTLVEVRADPSRRIALLLVRVRRLENRRAAAELAQRLRGLVRSKAGRGRQDLVAWLGGRDLAVLTAPLRTIQDAERIARRLLATPPEAAADAAPLRAAIGIVALGGPIGSANKALARARRAVAEAKEGGIGWADNLT